MDLTEAEDIKKRWQEYTEELHKKNLHDPDNHDGMITDLEPDIRNSQEYSPTPQFKTSILRCSPFFSVQLSHTYMTTGKTIALTRPLSAS